MPTANSLTKPKPAISMGMMAVDRSKFRVESVTPKPESRNNVPPHSKSSNPKPRPVATNGAHKTTSGRKGAPAKSSASRNGHSNHRDPVQSARSSASKRASPAVHTPTPMFDDDDDDDSESNDQQVARKRRRTDNGSNVDTSRIIHSVEVFDKEHSQAFDMVHAADIAHEGTKEQPTSNFHNYFPALDRPDAPMLKHSQELQYPSLSQRERYNLVVPKEKDDFKPIDEMIRVMTAVAKYYLEGSDASYVSDETSGLILMIRRALKRDNVDDFHRLVNNYNIFLEGLTRDSTITQLLSKHISPLPLPWVEQILTQTYSRTVSLRVDSLRRYENGTDNVYGELLPRFVSNIFKETKLRSSHVFVDLGSGVGNVVLQAALEIGCESWGCEMMPNACDLASLQEKEFLARCRLWGLRSGPVHLERGDFLANVPTLSVLKRADIVLVNNQAFTPSLNDKLIMHFLDLKEGCQIVSLKSFVPNGHKIQARNVDSPVNVLVDRELSYYSDSVSWTDAPGTYHIARKDRRGLEDFIRREMH